MASPKRKGSKLKTIITVILLVFAFESISDAMIYNTIMDVLNSDPPRTEEQGPSGTGTGSGSGDNQTGNAGGSGTENSGGGTSSGNGSGGSQSGTGNSGNQSGNTGSNGGSGSSGNQSGNTGNSGGSGGGTADKGETVGKGSLPNLPASMVNNVFVDARDKGISATLTGKVLVTTIFVSDKNTSWTKAEMDAVKDGHAKMTKEILAEAKSWGVELELILEYKTAAVTKDLAKETHTKWYQDALTGAGLTQYASRDLERSRGVKEAPILFYLNLPGRAFAVPRQTSVYVTEYAVFYNKEDGSATYRHELYHLFGAQDFYYPDEVETLAKKYFPNSPMMAGTDQKTDPLTAYLIGWTDKLSTEANTFLEQTNWITQQYMKDAHEKETYTGYVENWDMGASVFTGYLERGTPNGQGTMIWDDGRKYVGNWTMGQIDGKGKITYASGATYDGQWKKNQLHGQGTYTWSNGNKYIGNWVEGKRSGRGKLIYAEGTVYDGAWKNDKMNGQGTMTWTSGNKYVGQWKDSQRTGKGTYTYASGARYEGDFLNGKFYGTGTYTWTDGAKYVGAWKENQRTGQGKLTYANGTWYEGGFKDGKFHGTGTHVYKDGGKYVGQWANGVRAGQGIMYYADGARYEGEWANNLRHGQGTYYYANGSVYTGPWKNNVRVN